MMFLSLEIQWFLQPFVPIEIFFTENIAIYDFSQLNVVLRYKCLYKTHVGNESFLYNNLIDIL
jgi:hypothetical protein